MLDTFTLTAVASASDIEARPLGYQPTAMDRAILTGATIAAALLGPKVLGSVAEGLVGEEGAAAAEAAATKLKFSQTTASPVFSEGSPFNGKTISDVAGMLRTGPLTAADVPVQVVGMD